jgi:hypothetical protein
MGDEAKWLDQTCMAAYIDAAAGDTNSVNRMFKFGMEYSVLKQFPETLSDLMVACTKLKTQVRIAVL